MKKFWKSMPLMFGIIMLILIFTSSSISGEGKVIYVNDDASGDNNGTSWEDAYVNLQRAIDIAVSGDEIWVARGTYKPSRILYNGDPEATKSFILKSNIGIYGGFAGNEETRGQRDISENETILSGDLGNGTSVFNVVYGNELEQMVLEGFTITGGRAMVNSIYPAKGGGIYLEYSETAITLNNLIIKNNQAHDGGGVYVKDSKVNFSHVLITNNEATSGKGLGGGVTAENSDITFLHSKITNNKATMGGGITSLDSKVQLRTSLVAGNTASLAGAGIMETEPELTAASLAVNSLSFDPGLFLLNTTVTDNHVKSDDPPIVVFNNEDTPSTAGIHLAIKGNSNYHLGNSIVWGNGENTLNDNIYIEEIPEISLRYNFFYSIVGGLTSSEWWNDSSWQDIFNERKIIDEDPLLTNDYHLSPGSPAIDSGYTGVEFLPENDLDGKTRVVNGKIDMGPYEFQGTPDPEPEPKPDPEPEIFIESIDPELIEIPFGTPYDDIPFPTTVTVHLSNDTTAEVPVEWENFYDDDDISFETTLGSFTTNGDLDLSGDVTNPDSLDAILEVRILDNLIIQVDVEREVAPGKTYKIEGKDGKLTKSTITMPDSLEEDTRIEVQSVDVEELNTGKLVNVGDIYEIVVIDPIPGNVAFLAATSDNVTQEEPKDFILTLGYGKDANPDAIGVYFYNEETNTLELRGGEVDKEAEVISINVSKPHSDIYGVFQEPIEVVPIEEPDKEEPVEQPKEEPKEDKGGQKLPNTATSIHNWMLIGLGLLILGGIVFWFSKRRMA